jgi:hypothetical protein
MFNALEQVVHIVTTEVCRFYFYAGAIRVD